MFLMFKDEPVIQFDFRTNAFKIIDEEKAFYIVNNNNIKDIIDWVETRVPLLSSNNKRLIDEKYKIVNTKESKQYFEAISFAATSLKDCYWIKPERDDITWEQKNPRKHELRELCYWEDLKELLDSQEKYINPKEQGQVHGSAAKSWVYKKDDDKKVVGTYLYKEDLNKATIKNEIIASNILNHTNISHVKYTDINEVHCSCPNIANEDYSLLSSSEVNFAISKINKEKGYEYINPVNFAKEINPTLYAQMQVFDYLIGNTDRRIGNIGFIMDNETGCICDLAPLFDHGDSFEENFNNPDMKLKAMAALKDSHITFDKVLSAKDFKCDSKKYNEFMKRACELGIYHKKTRKKLFTKETYYELDPKYEHKTLCIHSDRDKQYFFKDCEFFSKKERFLETEVEEVREPLETAIKNADIEAKEVSKSRGVSQNKNIDIDIDIDIDIEL